MKAFLGLIAVLGLMFTGGLVFVAGWSWFVVPLGVPSINLAHAFGISTFFNCFLSSGKKSDINDVEGFAKRMIERFALLLTGLALMWIFSLFV